MKENFLHFLSDVPCILSINGRNLGTIDNLYSMELDVISKTNNIYVTYEPVSLKANAIPYTFSLNVDDTPSTESEYIKVIPFPNNNYDIIMKPFYYYQISDSTVLFNGSVGKYFVSILSDNICRITIFSGATIVFNTNTLALRKVKVESVKDTIVIEGVVDESTYYLLVIDTTDFRIIHSDTSHSIESTSDTISTYKKTGNICRHAKVCKIDLNTKNIESYYVYDGNTPNEKIHSMLIPEAFLQCVAVGDEKLAKSYLTDTYSSTNITQLKNYFGDIKEIYLNRHNFSLSKLNYTINSSTMKNYNFIMQNNKISDIEEVK